MSTHDQFLSEIEAYLKAALITPTAFGLAVMNDGKFVADLREGDRSPTLKTIDRVRQWMADNPARETAA